MINRQLPPHLLADTITSGSEVGWRKERFLTALSNVASAGFACLGGQFQWVLPEGTCEAYWLSADSTPRTAEEPWPIYVQRAANEVAQAYQSLLSTTDFNAEANRFEYLKDKKSEGVVLDHYLVFVASFVAADDA